MAHGFKDDDEERRAHYMYAMKAAEERRASGGGRGRILGRRIAALACLAFAVLGLIYAAKNREPVDWLGVLFFGSVGLWGLRKEDVRGAARPGTARTPSRSVTGGPAFDIRGLVKIAGNIAVLALAGFMAYGLYSASRRKPLNDLRPGQHQRPVTLVKDPTTGEYVSVEYEDELREMGLKKGSSRMIVGRLEASE